MENELNQGRERLEIGQIVKFKELDYQTVVERALTTMGSGHYMVKISSDKASPVIKKGDQWVMQKGEILIESEKDMRVVGFVSH